MSKIKKTTFTITVLHRDDVDPAGMQLTDVLHEMDEGCMIGTVEHVDTIAVPAAQVANELVELGNDGEFFADDEDEDDGLAPTVDCLDKESE